MGLGLIEEFVRAVRTAVGLPNDPGAPPDLIRLGLYEATITECSADGKTCSVTPADRRIPPKKNVSIRAGVPAAQAVISDGATALVGWERGDPEAMYVVPAWN